MEEWPLYLSTVTVNNHLGYLHNKYTDNWNPEKAKEKKINLVRHHLLSNIVSAQNVLPKDLANKIREFIYAVPFDKNVKLLSDNNFPLKTAFEPEPKSILQVYENRLKSPSDWKWEHYTKDIWRLTPLSLNAYVGSPIPSLITVLEATIRSSNFIDVDLSSLSKGTWVIQKIAQNHSLSIHSDYVEHRMVSFIYYLTPDNWEKKDGGGLFMYDPINKKYRRIHPQFNSLVMWKVDKEESGLHYVETIRAPNTKNRIALVGFFDKLTQ